MAAAQLLVTGRADAALLPEPMATLPLSSSGVITRDLFRTIDIQQAWHEATGLGAKLPQAGSASPSAFSPVTPARWKPCMPGW